MKSIFISIVVFLFVHTCLAQQPRLILPVGHTDNVTTAHFSPDGRTVLTASTDKSAKLWDVRTGALLLDLPNENGGFTQFSPDGSMILTIGTGCEIFETKTGNRIKSYSGDNYAYRINTFNSANFSRDGKMIVTTSDNNNAEVWDVESERLLARLRGHSYHVNYAEFSPDGEKIVTASWDSTARIWDVKSGTTLFVLNLGHFVQLAKFSPDGQKVATISVDTIVRIWDVSTGKLIANLVGHTNYPENFAFSADSKRIVTTSEDRTAKIWDAESGKLLTDIIGHFDVVNSACFSPDGSQLLTASDDGGAILWDAITGKPLLGIYNHSLPVNTACFSSDGKRILTASNDNTAAIWNIVTQKLETQFAGRTMTPVETIFSPIGTKILTGYIDGIARVLDYLTGKIILSLKDHKGGISSVEYNYDGTRILTASFDSTAKIWNALTGKLLFTLKGFKGSVYSASFSWDGKKIVTASEDSTIKLWDTQTGKLLMSKKQKTGVSGAKFFPDGKAVINFSGGWYDSTRVWDISTGFFRPFLNKNILSNIPITPIRNIKFSPDGKRMMMVLSFKRILIMDINSKGLLELDNGSYDVRDASFSSDGYKIITSGIILGDNPSLLNSFTGKNIYNYSSYYSEQHKDVVYSACFSPDEKITATASRDNTVRIWNAKNGNLIYTYLVTSDDDYLLKETSGFYLSTPASSKLLHYVTKDLKVISFEQLDVKYNRPDKVLEAIGNTDTALINSYKRAYYKRIKKLGIDTTQFSDGYSVPEADFENRDNIVYEQRNEQLIVRINSNDITYKLDRFNIWINEVPLFGIKGISIKHRNNNQFDTTISINLSQGENRIETSVTNVNGTESYRMPLYVKYTAAKPVKETIHFIGIGINQFADSRRNLQWCVKDIRDIALKLKEKYRDRIIIDTLFDQNVTLSNVQALKQKLLKTNINDKVIIAYSGHGLLSKQYDYYLSSFDVNFSKPEENGIAYEEIENLLDNIPARKKLLLLDACHSGEVDKEEMLVIQTAKTKAGNKGLIMNRGSEEENKTETKTVGLQNSFELMQSLFVNVGKGTGTTIISAAGGVQFAQERDDLENGVFTFSLLEAMKQFESIKVSELKKFVGQRVEQLTNGMQKPTTRNELKDFDWEVW